MIPPASKKTALILGISGQDGAYLARLLVDRGYTVHGTSRDAEVNGFRSLIAVGVRESVALHTAVLTDFRSILQIISKVRPDEIYNLAGQSSVGLSFQQPVETLESIAVGTLNVLEVIRFLDYPARLYNAGSSECFGDTGGVPADEATCFRPRSPYAVAKSAAHWEVVNYRESYGLFACNGILFNHESPLRPARFVTRKVVRGALDIARGRREGLRLGNLGIRRDWGWAPEYVEAMWLMLQQQDPADYVIATGQAHSLSDFVAEAFRYFSLDWRDHVETDPTLLRPSEIEVSVGEPSKARARLSWHAKIGMADVVRRMAEAEDRADDEARR